MQKDLVRDMIQRFFKSMVITTRDFTIALTNGTTIRILCAEEIRRDSAGLRATKIVVDEAGTIGGNLLDILTRCLADQRKAQMLLLSTEMKKDSLLEQVSNKQPSSALYVSYDYVDALREKAITPKQVFQYKSDLTPAYFASEFGPYTTFNIDNQTMEHVLRALDEYV
jgi:hypothetical protein